MFYFLLFAFILYHLFIYLFLIFLHLLHYSFLSLQARYGSQDPSWRPLHKKQKQQYEISWKSVWQIERTKVIAKNVLLTLTRFWQNNATIGKHSSRAFIWAITRYGLLTLKFDLLWPWPWPDFDEKGKFSSLVMYQYNMIFS